MVAAKAARGKCEEGQVCDVGQGLCTEHMTKGVCGFKQDV